MIDLIFKDIVKKLDIDRFVETGTDKGETVAEVSRWFAELEPSFGTVTGTLNKKTRTYQLKRQTITYPLFSKAKPCSRQVHSVDSDAYSYKTVKNIFKDNPNIFLHHKNSPDFLAALLHDEIASRSTRWNYLFFLDAHWDRYLPLQDELRLIRHLEKYAVVIDDCFVPGKSDPAFPNGNFGFDVYGGRILSWACVRQVLQSDPVRIFYPLQANRDLRGWALITKGYQDQQLSFFKNMCLFEMSPDDPLHAFETKLSWRGHWDARNILKKLVPVPLLRGLHRAYEKFL